MKKAKKVCVAILACCLILFLGYLYVVLVYMRTPGYILKNVTPQYEKEAEDFFYGNQADLTLLSELKETIEDGFNYYYVLHLEQHDASEIPDEIARILLRLEQNTDQQYPLSISSDRIEIRIRSNRSYNVYLFYGSRRNHGMRDAWNRVTQLEDNWELYATYMIRA